VYLIS